MSSLEKSSKTTVPTLLELTAQSHYSNRIVVKYYSNMTMHKALMSKSSSVGLLAKKDESMVIRCITNLFKATALYFDNQLSYEKALVISDEILAKYEYRSLKLEDILVICIRIKESDIFKLTIAKIMAEIRRYTKEREQLAINNSLQLSDSNKNSINANIEGRLHKHFKSLPNADKIASKRLAIKRQFK